MAGRWAPGATLAGTQVRQGDTSAENHTNVVIRDVDTPAGEGGGLGEGGVPGRGRADVEKPGVDVGGTRSPG